jgi:hypothetical protein
LFVIVYANLFKLLPRKISQIETFNIIDSEDEIEPISYCPRCKKLNHLSILKERIYLPDQPVPSDNDLWKQCHECGTIVPVYEIEKDSSIKDVIETTDNPFDIGTSFLGIDSRTSIEGKNARKKRERQKQLEDIKDDEVKRELSKGNTLISYIEYQSQ